MRHIKVDMPFLVSVCILVVAGYLIFASASLGLLSKQAVKYGNVAFNQTFFGLFLGLLAMFITSQIDYKIYRKYSFYIFAGLAIFLVGGGKWKHIFLLSLIGLLGITIIAYNRPYVMNRINTFIHPSENSLGSGYQIQQSLIAIGSGGFGG